MNNPMNNPPQKGTTMAPKTVAAAKLSENVGLTFEDAEVPTTTSRRENPFLDVVKALAESMNGEDKSPTARAFKAPKDDAPAMIRDAQAAGRAHGVTVRIRPVENADGTLTVTFWTVKAIRKQSK